MNGETDWGPINTLIPKTSGKTTLGDHLITFAAYSAVPGAMVWASVQPGQEENVPVNVLLPTLLLARSASTAALVRNYAYAGVKLQQVGMLAETTVTAGVPADIGSGVSIAAADDVIADVG